MLGYDCIDPSSCPHCPLRHNSGTDSDPAGETPDSGSDHEIEFDPTYGVTHNLGVDEQDPVGNIGSEMTLKEHLLGLLRATVAEQDYYIGKYIINNLNQRGWLGDTIESIALDLTIPPPPPPLESEVCRLPLAVVQSFDPPGVGAQNIQECLLLQIRYLQGKENPKDPGGAYQSPCRTDGTRECFEHVPLHRYAKNRTSDGNLGRGDETGY